MRVPKLVACRPRKIVPATFWRNLDGRTRRSDRLGTLRHNHLHLVPLNRHRLVWALFLHSALDRMQAVAMFHRHLRLGRMLAVVDLVIHFKWAHRLDLKVGDESSKLSGQSKTSIGRRSNVK
jgi:hypothetical protein